MKISTNFNRGLRGAAQSMESVSRGLADRRSVLRCGQCLRQEQPTAQDMVGYFRSGWPKCCGYTMTLVTP